MMEAYAADGKTWQTLLESILHVLGIGEKKPTRSSNLGMRLQPRSVHSSQTLATMTNEEVGIRDSI